MVSAIHGGMSKKQACAVYCVCKQTIYNWLALEKEQGDLTPKTGFQRGHSHGIPDHDAFRAFVDAHPDSTQEELAAHFGLGSSTVGRTLKKIGYTRKKAKRTASAARKKEPSILTR